MASRERQQPLLPSVADQEQVADRVADQAGREPARVHEADPAGSGGVDDRLSQPLRWEGEVRRPVKSPVVAASRFTTAAVTPLRIVGTACGPPRRCRSPAPAAPTGGHARRPISWVGAIFRCESTAPPFWASPIMSSAAMPLPSRCAAMPSRAATVHAGAADAGDDDAVGSVQRRQLGLGRTGNGSACAEARPCATGRLDGHEAGAEALEAGEVLVAGRLVDPAPAELGLLRLDGDAVAGHPQSPQPSQTSSLITTRSSGSGKAPRLRRRRFSAAQVWSKTRAETPGTSRRRRCTASSSSRWCTRTPGAQAGGRPGNGWLVGDDRDLLDPLRAQQAGDRRHVEVAGLHLLAAGHGDRVVVEDLEGDVGARRHGRADRQRARVVERRRRRSGRCAPAC